MLLYKERISHFLHHLHIFNKTIDLDLSGMELEIDIAQWETGVIFPSEREKVQHFLVTETGSFFIRYDIQERDVEIVRLHFWLKFSTWNDAQ